VCAEIYPVTIVGKAARTVGEATSTAATESGKRMKTENTAWKPRSDIKRFRCKLQAPLAKALRGGQHKTAEVKRQRMGSQHLLTVMQ